MTKKIEKAKEKTETQERFENILGKLVSVSKKDIEEREKAEKQRKEENEKGQTC